MAQQTVVSRRSFPKSSALAGGGLLISFSWMNGFAFKGEGALAATDEFAVLYGYLKIATNGLVTIISPNPEGGQNVKTSMPMIVDGIGNALFGGIRFNEGVSDKNNFHSYRMIRHSEAPKSIDVPFVQNDFDPTGMGEPGFPPVFAALANGLYKATGKRFYDQPFVEGL